METIQDLFNSMEKHDYKKAFVTRDQTVTYEQLIKKSFSLATGLKRVINPGDKIAVWLPNSIEWVLIELAAGLIGATVVTLNLRYKKHELTYILQDSKTKMLILQPELEGYNYTSIVEELLNEQEFPDLKYIVSSDKLPTNCKFKADELVTFFNENESRIDHFESESSNPNNILNIMYTSGTTSNPKGVMISQRAAVKHSNNAAKYLRITSEDIVLGALPFCGVFGFNTLFGTLTSGACMVPMDRYRPFDALELIEEFQCTVFNGVDGMITPLFDKKDIAFNLDAMRIGAFPIFATNNQLFIERTEKIFPNMTVVQPYGMTEVGSMLFVGDPDESVEVRTLAGGPRVSKEIEIEIIDKETGVPLKNGEEGEIVVGGYSVMSGYYGNPEKTKESLTADGKFKTGDLGVKLDNGSIIYKGRLRDALRLRGFLVSPKEIEDFISLMPEVEIAQIVHVTTEKNDRLVAFIKLKEGKQITDQQIFKYCKEGLADFKCPNAIIFVNEFPTTAGSNGEKIQKNKLQEIAKIKLKEKDLV
ncbi:AMP-binding protein [Bacillus dakarensis]|uniref:AMP-binding protein n=1 Tax=Robertmurraya dakarensis TaxID=1926278 RepID=UPI000980B599|nr:AMP-binding protein [Bacillus dakarensis]